MVRGGKLGEKTTDVESSGQIIHANGPGQDQEAGELDGLTG